MRTSAPGLCGALLVAALAAIVLLGIAVQVFYDFPPPWPDEVLFAAPARSLIEDGRLATKPLAGLLPGAGERTYWMPPGYFVWLAGWFAVAGASLEVMRSASLAAALMALACVAVLGRCVMKLPTLAVLAVLLVVALDPLFVRGAIIGRMDMLTLALTLAALLLSRAQTSRQAFVAGVFCGAAGLCHPLGAIALPSVALGISAAGAPRGDMVRRLAWLAAGLATVLLPFGLYVAADFSTFLQQMEMQLGRKTGDPLLRRLAKVRADAGMQMALADLRLGLLVAGVTALALASRTNGAVRAAGCAGVLFVLAVTWSNEMWYHLHVVPFAAIGWATLLQQRGWRPAAGLAALLALACLSAFRDADAVRHARGRDYPAFAAQIESELIAWLPAGTRVFVIAIPDPAASLMHRARHVEWRTFSPVPVPADVYQEWVAGSDVMIFGDGWLEEGDRISRRVIESRRAWPTIEVRTGGFHLTARIRPELAVTRTSAAAAAATPHDR